MGCGSSKNAVVVSQAAPYPKHVMPTVNQQVQHQQWQHHQPYPHPLQHQHQQCPHPLQQQQYEQQAAQNQHLQQQHTVQHQHQQQQQQLTEHEQQDEQDQQLQPQPQPPPTSENQQIPESPQAQLNGLPPQGQEPPHKKQSRSNHRLVRQKSQDSNTSKLTLTKKSSHQQSSRNKLVSPSASTNSSNQDTHQVILEHLLPTCGLYRPEEEVKHVTHYQLAAHNGECWSRKNLEDLWTLDDRFVYNGYKLFQSVQNGVQKNFQHLYPKRRHRRGFWSLVSFEDCKPEFLEILENEKCFSLSMFILKQLDVPYYVMKRAMCEAFIGELHHEPDEDTIKQIQWLKALQNSMKDKLNDSIFERTNDKANFTKVIGRHLSILDSGQKKQNLTGDINKQEFCLPNGVLQNELRPWMPSWKKFVTHNKLSILRERTPNLVFKKTKYNSNPDYVPVDRGEPFDTSVDGEVAWKTLEIDVIKRDDATSYQIKRSKSLEGKRRPTNKQRQQRYNFLLCHIKKKYELTSACDYWFENMVNSWRDFQQICEIWTPEQRSKHLEPKVDEQLFVNGNNHVISERCPEEPFSPFGIWETFLTDRTGLQKLEALPPRKAYFNKRQIVDDNLFGDNPSKYSKQKSFAIDRPMEKTVPRERKPVGDDSQNTITQLKLVVSDLEDAHGHIWQEAILQVINNYIDNPDYDHQQQKLDSDPIKEVFRFPQHVNIDHLRKGIQTQGQLTFVEDIDRRDECTYASQRSSDGKEVEPSKSATTPMFNKDIQASSTRIRRPRAFHRCSRSVDLHCYLCKGCVVIAGSKKKEKYLGLNILDWSDLSPSEIQKKARTTPQHRAKLRQRLFEYFTKTYKYDDSALDLYKGWSSRMEQHWEDFQNLCQK